MLLYSFFINIKKRNITTFQVFQANRHFSKRRHQEDFYINYYLYIYKSYKVLLISFLLQMFSINKSTAMNEKSIEYNNIDHITGPSSELRAIVALFLY